MDKIHIAACDDDPGILDVYSYLIAECFLLSALIKFSVRRSRV